MRGAPIVLALFLAAYAPPNLQLPSPKLIKSWVLLVNDAKGHGMRAVFDRKDQCEDAQSWWTSRKIFAICYAQ
jgi:hypothetical protein